MYVLSILLERETASPSEIAELLELKKPTVTDLIDRMERDQLVMRTAHPTSRKLQTIELTTKGKKTASKAHELLREADKSLNKILHGKLYSLKNEIDLINAHFRDDERNSL